MSRNESSLFIRNSHYNLQIETLSTIPCNLYSLVWMERYTTALQRDGGCLHEYTDPGVPRLFVLVAIHGRWRRLNNTVPATPNKYEQPSPSVTTAPSINHFAEFLKISDRFRDIQRKDRRFTTIMILPLWNVSTYSYRETNLYNDHGLSQFYPVYVHLSLMIPRLWSNNAERLVAFSG